jgi:hypothetical protein
MNLAHVFSGLMPIYEESSCLSLSKYASDCSVWNDLPFSLC